MRVIDINLSEQDIMDRLLTSPIESVTDENIENEELAYTDEANTEADQEQTDNEDN